MSGQPIADQITVRDAHTGEVVAVHLMEPMLDAMLAQAADLTRLRRLVLEVASLGIVTDEDRVGPAAPGHHWLEMPVALWDRIETEASRG